jgi:hypothetical protein
MVEESILNGCDCGQKTAKLFMKNRSSSVSPVTHLLRLKIPRSRSSLSSLYASARATGATPRPDHAPLRRPHASRLLLLLLLLLASAF